MRSNNPVFNNADGFNGRSSTNAYGNETYPGSGAAYPGYGQAPTQGQYGSPYGQPTQGQYGDPSTWDTTRATTGTGARMTIDSVVQKTGIGLGVVIVMAALTWLFTGDINATDNANKLYLALVVGSGAAFVLSLVNSFKRVISPALVLVFCAAEGVALGALSKFFDGMFGDGIVVQAVIGTFAAFGGTLAAYKFLNIRVSNGFRKFVIAAMFGMVGLALFELVLSAFGASMGVSGFGGIGLLFAIAGLVLGVFMLILDFDFVEQGVAAGLPEVESWRAAFGLTVSLVWIYTNLLRILAIFSDN